MKAMYEEKVLKKLQKVELEILEEFIRICNKYNIEYFALYGTAIGAIRHKGFIPWDDDIDIGMLRKDYDKFLEVAKYELNEKYTVMNGDICPSYPVMTSRVMKKGTEFRDLSLKNVKCEFGIFLDLFAFDNIPDDTKLRGAQIKKAWLFSKLHILRTLPFPTLAQEGLLRVIIHSVCWCMHNLMKIFISNNYFYKKCKHELVKYNNVETEDVAFICETNPYLNIIKKSDIFPLVNYKFENFIITMPKEIDKILRLQYGDYMQLPPEDKRSIHRPYKLEFGD